MIKKNRIFLTMLTYLNTLSPIEIPTFWKSSSPTWQASSAVLPEKKIIVVVPSYKNALWYLPNLLSICEQQYDNFHVIYIDDCSPDQTGDLVEKFIQNNKLDHRITLIKNKVRVGALHNLYTAIHSCSDDAIIVTVDGDDWLACNNVLQIINEAYHSQNVWLTYGQFVMFPEKRTGFCQELPPENVARNDYRNCGGYSHLRTFYAGLFKKIKKEDLCHEGQFYPMSWDVAMMTPMFEMAQGKYKFIPHITYVYNTATTLNDFKVDAQLQWNLDVEIRQKTPYQPIVRDW